MAAIGIEVGTTAWGSTPFAVKLAFAVYRGGPGPWNIYSERMESDRGILAKAHPLDYACPREW